MTEATHDHPACRYCCRATHADGTPCKRKSYLPRPHPRTQNPADTIRPPAPKTVSGSKRMT